MGPPVSVTHICEYPLNQPGAALVFRKGIESLDDGQWLNDNIISIFTWTCFETFKLRVLFKI